MRQRRARGPRKSRCHSGPNAPAFHRHRWLAVVLALTASLTACDDGRAPGAADPEPPATALDSAPTNARSPRFLALRDAIQSGQAQLVARSPSFVLIREEARHANP